MLINKKIVLFIIFLFVVFNVFSQTSTPIIGYDRVRWGATVQEVTQIYTTMREITSEDASLGVREFTQRNVGGGIEIRYFFFFNNRLFKVAVHYEEQRDPTSAFLALADRLVAIYGRFDDRDSFRRPSGNFVLSFLTDLDEF